MGNLYTPDQVGIKPPSGGFATGGWYSGRQYWGGMFSDPGVINPNSNQVGAGAAVNPSVVAAGNVQQGLAPGTNEAYIQKQTALNPTPTAQATPAVATPSTSGSAGAGTTGAGAGVGFMNAPTINLPEIYQGLYKTAGIEGLQKQLSDETLAFNAAQSKINDNPFLSEAKRVGRIQKLQTDFNANTANLRNDISTKKADVETQLNIQTKQFDINSEQAKTAFSQFQTLLSSGALDNASGEDIANITRATGLSSTMIYAAVNAQKAKDVKTSVIEYDDGTNQGFAVVNTQTGEIIKKETIAPSKPKATSVSDQKEADQQTNEASATADAKAGYTLRQLVANYAVAGGLSVEDVYRIYNMNSTWGKANESLADVKEGKFQD
jgi:phosphoribosylanthranilate isomerase